MCIRDRARYVRILPGKDATLTLRFQLPPSIDRVVMEPSGRVKQLRWYFNGHEYMVEKRRTVEFGDSP